MLYESVNLKKDHGMIETRRLENVIFFQSITVANYIKNMSLFMEEKNNCLEFQN